VTRILQPIWTTKPETASRVRGLIESVLAYATTHGWRTGENPARWKGHLDNLVPARGKVANVEHHAALAWRDIGAFMVELAGQPGVSALALRFAILTAARTGEVIGARWSEIDLKEAVWAVPKDRMKAGREHGFRWPRTPWRCCATPHSCGRAKHRMASSSSAAMPAEGCPTWPW